MSTGSLRSAVTSEETDVGVMLKEMSTSQLLALGLAQSLIADARITSTVCRWSVQGAAVVKLSERLGLVDSRCYVDPKKGRSLIGPKDGQDGWICRTLRNADRKRIRCGPHIIVAIRNQKIDNSRSTIPRSTFQIDDSQIDIPDRHSRLTNPDRHYRLDRDR